MPSINDDPGVGEQINFGEVLDRLGYSRHEFLGIGWQPVGRSFRAEVRNREDAIGFVFGYLPACDYQSDVWFSLNPVAVPQFDEQGRSRRGRGTSEDATRLAGLVLDLDLKPGAFESIEQIEKFIAVFCVLLGMRPVLLVYSGHGIQPFWAVEHFDIAIPSDQDRAQRLVRRFGGLAARVAIERFEARLDPVFDLARMVRMPGTVNHKNPRQLGLAYAVADSGQPRSVEWFEKVLAELGVPEAEATRRRFTSAAPWTGTPPGSRQQKYLDAVLKGQAKKVADASWGYRNDTLYTAALKLGSFVTGAGMDEQKVIAALEDAAEQCGLIDDDGCYAVGRTIASGLHNGMANPRAVPENSAGPDVARMLRRARVSREARAVHAEMSKPWKR